MTQQLQDSMISKANKINKFLSWILAMLSIITVVGAILGYLPLYNALFAGTLVIITWGMLYFMSHKATFTLEQVGIENIQFVGAKMSSEWRDSVWERGYLTINDWSSACHQVGIKF